MTEALLVSNALLWVALVALLAVVAALARQVGVLHERLAPVGALATQRGPVVGEPAPEFDLVDLAGGATRIGGADPSGARTLLFFLSPTCPVCKTLLPTARRLVAEAPTRARLVLASDGAPAEHESLLRDAGLSGDGYVLSLELGLRFQVARLPYAVLIDGSGIVRAKGLVNTREHLESLFEAEAHDVASLQDYLERERRPLELAGEGARS